MGRERLGRHRTFRDDLISSPADDTYTSHDTKSEHATPDIWERSRLQDDRAADKILGHHEQRQAREAQDQHVEPWTAPLAS